MGTSLAILDKQAERRRVVAGMYLRRTPKGEIAKAVGCRPETITRDVRWLKELWAKELLTDPVEQQARDLAALDQLEKDAATKYLATGLAMWWDRVLRALERRAKMLGLDYREPLPGSSRATPFFIAQVGYDINEMVKDPEIRQKILEIDQRIKALTGGEGIVIEGEGGVVQEDEN